MKALPLPGGLIGGLNRFYPKAKILIHFLHHLYILTTNLGGSPLNMWIREECKNISLAFSPVFKCLCLEKNVFPWLYWIYTEK